MRRIVRDLAVVVAVLLMVAVTAVITRPAPTSTRWSFVHDYRWWWFLVVVVAITVVLLRWLLRTLLGRTRCSPWRAHVLATADALDHQLDALPAGRSRAKRALKHSVSQAVEQQLRAARKFASWQEEEEDTQRSISQRFVDWWTGAPCEAAYLHLHEAEIALAQLLPDDEIEAGIPEALARLQTMDVTDPRRLAEKQLALSTPRSQRRAAFQSAVRIGLELKDQQHTRAAFPRPVTSRWSRSSACWVAACLAPSPSATCRAPQHRTTSLSRLPCSSFHRVPSRHWSG